MAASRLWGLLLVLSVPNLASAQEISPERTPQERAAQESASLETPRGREIGVQSSSYRYYEPGIDVSLSGGQLGARAAYTGDLGSRRFVRTDLSAAYGELEYRGSGVALAQPNFTFEARTVLGADLNLGDEFVLAPYVGFGYRYLFSDLRGRSSSGAAGYRRYSQYFYMPLGLSARLRTAEGWIVSPRVEYDRFLGGRQETKLSDAGLGDHDVRNRQNVGYGYRAALMFEHRQFRFGPWVQVWHIADSDVVPSSATRSVFEPRNQTEEFGVEVNVRF